MKKTPLYSRSSRSVGVTSAPAPRAAAGPESTGLEPSASSASGPAPGPGAVAPRTRRARFAAFLGRQERRLWAAGMVLLIAAFWWHASRPVGPAPLTMKQIDSAMRQSIAEKPLDSAATNAFNAIIPSVVRVVGLMSEDDDGRDPPDRPGGKPSAGEKPSARPSDRPADKPGDKPIAKPGEKPGEKPFERGVGTGVVIVDNGTILTNLHVVAGAKKIRVTFMDGTESDAMVLSTQPENDLAVLRARSIPDDLKPATMRSTADLSPGDEVIAVGFPFGIGPSVSSGIVSGLKREFRSPDGQQMLSNLIQFDAAANPGNSGGPLVTMDGSVVGIVTAILNPNRQRVFVGIGFAVPIENAAAGAGMPPF